MKKPKPAKTAPRAQPILWVFVLGLLAIIGLIVEKSWRTFETVQTEAAKGSDQLTGYYAVMFCALAAAGFLGAACWALGRKALGK